MQYSNSPRWDIDGLNFDFIGKIFDAYINCPVGENIDNISDDILFDPIANETVHRLAKSNITMTRRQIEVKIKHFVRAVLPRTISLNAIVASLMSGDLEHLVKHDDSIASRQYLYNVESNNVWTRMVVTLIEKSKNKDRFKKIIDMVSDPRNGVRHLLKLRINNNGKISLFLPIHYDTGRKSLSATFDLEDVKISTFMSMFDTSLFKEFTAAALNLVRARFAMFFMVQRLIISGRKEEVEAKLYDCLLNQVIPESDNPEWTTNYAPDTAHIKFSVKCTERMKCYPHFSTKEYIRGVMKVQRNDINYGIILDGVSFTEYRSSFGIHTALNNSMSDLCAGVNFPKEFGVPTRNNPTMQDALFLTHVFDFIYANMNNDSKTWRFIQSNKENLLALITVEMKSSNKRVTPRKKRYELDRVYGSKAYQIDIDRRGKRQYTGAAELLNDKDQIEGGYLNRNDVKFMLLINNHDAVYATDNTPKQTFNIITNSIFWKHWASVSTGEILYITDIASIFDLTFLTNILHNYIKLGKYEEVIKFLLSTPLAESLSLTSHYITGVLRQNSHIAGIQGMVEQSKELLAQYEASHVSNHTLLTSQQFVSLHEPKKFLPPIMKRMMNVTSAFPKVAGGQCDPSQTIIYKKNANSFPKIEKAGSGIYGLYTTGALNSNTKERKDFKYALLNTSLFSLLHMILVHVTGSRIGGSLSTKGKLFAGRHAQDVIDNLMKDKSHIIPLINTCSIGNPLTVMIEYITGLRINADMSRSFSLGEMPAITTKLPNVVICNKQYYFGGGPLVTREWYDISDNAKVDNDIIFSNTGETLITYDLFAPGSATETNPTLKQTYMQVQDVSAASQLLKETFNYVLTSPTLNTSEKHSIEALCHPRYSALKTFLDSTSEEFINKFSPSSRTRKKVYTWMNLPKLEKVLTARLQSVLKSGQTIKILQTAADFTEAGKHMKNCVAGRSYTNGSKGAFCANEGSIITHFYVLIKSDTQDDRWCMDFKVRFSSSAQDTIISLSEGRGYSNLRSPDKTIPDTIMLTSQQMFKKYFTKYCIKLTNHINDITKQDSNTNFTTLFGDITSKITCRYTDSFGGGHTRKDVIFNAACANAPMETQVSHLSEQLEQMFNTYIETMYILRHNKVAASVIKKHKFIDEALAKLANNSHFLQNT